MKRDPFDSEVTADQIDRYLAGGSTPAEAAYVSAYLARHPEVARYHRSLHAALSPAIDRASVDVERAFAALDVRSEVSGQSPIATSAPQRGTIPVRRIAPRSPSSWRIVTFAVVGAAMIAAIVVALPHLQAARHARTSEVISRVYMTARGQQTTVPLGDGSTVALAPETRVRVSDDANGARTVDLVGEALFTVAPHANRPFIVRTGAVTTRVLGTVFDVRRYPGDATTHVAVASGRVATGGHVAPVVLAAGMIGQVGDSSATVSVNEDPDRMTSWTRGRLIFQDAPVSVVLATLGRWYGYEFRLTDTTLAGLRVSVGVNTDQVTAAMNTLKAVLGVTMTFDGNVVTLRPERHESRATRSKRAPESFGTAESEVGK